MEVKAELLKPFEENEKMAFIVEQNHQNGYEIKETELALEAWGYTEKELAEQEKLRIAKLFLTAADVERGIYKAKGLDFDDIIAMVEIQQPNQVKALKIELKANNFYRGNPYVETIGKMLGFTDEQLNLFFEDGNYEHLLEEKVNDNTTDSTESTINANEVSQ